MICALFLNKTSYIYCIWY